jgi:hypothetical protein
MTTYRVPMSDDLLQQFRADDTRLPECLRIGEVLSPAPGEVGEPPGFRCSYVQVEDAEAPADLEDQLVELVFRSWYTDGAELVRTTVEDRRVVSRA